MKSDRVKVFAVPLCVERRNNWMIKIRREQIAGMNMHYKYRTLDYFFKTQQALGIKNIEFWCARPHFLLEIMGLRMRLN